jgi:putative PIN family toxin of toxin-antitoxin system
MTRAVVDTNILLRAIIKPLGTVAPVIVRFEQDRFRLIYSQWLLDEITEKLELPRIRLKYNISRKDIARFFDLLIEKGERVEPERVVNICRDADDNHVIEAALAGNAEFIVTGDDDLLSLRQFETIQFVTPREFLSILDEREQS